MARMLVALTLVFTTGTELLAEENLVVIEMTGKLATEYARCTEGLKEGAAPAGFQIQTLATITQRLDDGRIRFEHSLPISREGKPGRLVTLTGIVDQASIKTDIVPKGAKTYANPGAKPSSVTTKDAKTLRLELSNLKGLKLRTYTLSEEIGE